MQPIGYNNTLCSLTLSLSSRRICVDMDNLIPKDALLDAIEDDDDIDWNTDPFEYPDHVDRK